MIKSMSNTAYNYGWICPKCGTVYSPSVPECYKCGKEKVEEENIIPDAYNEEPEIIYFPRFKQGDLAILKCKYSQVSDSEYIRLSKGTEVIVIKDDLDGCLVQRDSIIFKVNTSDLELVNKHDISE